MGHVKTVLQPGAQNIPVVQGEQGKQGVPGPVTIAEPRNVLIWTLSHSLKFAAPWPSSISATLQMMRGDMWKPPAQHVFTNHATKAVSNLKDFILATVVNPRISAYAVTRMYQATLSSISGMVEYPDTLLIPIKIHITKIKNTGEVYWNMRDNTDYLLSWKYMAQNFLPPSKYDIDIVIIGDRDSV